MTLNGTLRLAPVIWFEAFLTFAVSGKANSQELEPRSYSPSPIGTTFVLGGIGKSEGGILFDPSLSVDNVHADLWFVTAGFGHVFSLAGRQARILVVVPAAWGDIAGEVDQQPVSAKLSGLVDPRIKLSIALKGAPALTFANFGKAPRHAVIGASLTVMPPVGQYSSAQLVNLGYNRWALKPELGVSRPIGRWSMDAYAGTWLFTTNRTYFPGTAEKSQDPIYTVQSHVGYTFPTRYWVALDGTWFSGGHTSVNGADNSDSQNNVRVGGTLSIPLGKTQSLKLTYSTGLVTRRGNDFNTFAATWQLVML